MHINQANKMRKFNDDTEIQYFFQCNQKFLTLLFGLLRFENEVKLYIYNNNSSSKYFQSFSHSLTHTAPYSSKKISYLSRY